MILVDHQNINITTGDHEYGPADVPETVRDFTCRLARCTTATPTFWPNSSTVADIALIVSNDGWVTEIPAGKLGGSPGGIVHTPIGTEAVESLIHGGISAPIGPGWQIKARVSVTNGPLRSQVTVEVN